MEKYSKIETVAPYNGYHLNSVGFELYEIGIDIIKKNKLAVVILAGGQGTRLGTKDPKGCYILPTINKSLFQLHSENVREMCKLHECKISLIIMTSSFTHDKTVAYFADNNNFGCQEIIFVQQSDAICHDLENKPLKWYDDYARAPNGNGSIFKTFKDAKIYEKLQKVEYFNVISVDNALSRICDAILVGLIEKSKLDCVSKTIEKLKDESVGVFVNENNKLVVKEYSELSSTNKVKEHSAAHDNTNKGSIHIKTAADKSTNIEKDKNDTKAAYMTDMTDFTDANICHHIFHVDFMKKMADMDLPVHKAKKKIPYTINGKEIEPEDKNGYKDEYFIFDCFDYTTKNAALKVPRELEFAAIKNNDKEQTDTPSLAVKALFTRNKILTNLKGCQILDCGSIVWPTKSVLGDTLNVFIGRIFKNEITKE
ncbi:UDP-N-acetylglucosamine pyrophosphorylase [Binucleata daphniae]